MVVAFCWSFRLAFLLRSRLMEFQVTSSTSYARTVYGLGVSYNINERWGIATDYTQVKRVSSEKTNTALISVGVRYKF